MEEVLVPLALFGVIPLTVWAVSAYRHKSMKATTEVMKAMVEKGDTLTPETIRSLGVRPRRKHGDLRTGLTFFESEIVGFALVGLVYVGLWTFIGRKNPED